MNNTDPAGPLPIVCVHSYKDGSTPRPRICGRTGRHRALPSSFLKICRGSTLCSIPLWLALRTPPSASSARHDFPAQVTLVWDLLCCGLRMGVGEGEGEEGWGAGKKRALGTEFLVPTHPPLGCFPDETHCPPSHSASASPTQEPLIPRSHTPTNAHAMLGATLGGPSNVHPCGCSSGSEEACGQPLP